MIASITMTSDLKHHHHQTAGTEQIVVPEAEHSRFAGKVHGTGSGSCLICLGSIHGNEPAGALALARVFKVFDACGLQSKMHGDFVGIFGNLQALEAGKRYIHHDLNRAWDPAHISSVRQMTDEKIVNGNAEDIEQRALIYAIEEVQRQARGPIYFVDLHTTSATSRPFVLIGDTLRNRDFATRFPVPIILGLEEQVDGTVTEWMHLQGAISMGYESGRHDDPASVDRHEAGIWLALAGTGVLDKAVIPNFAKYENLLAKAAHGLPHFIEVRYRHGITERDLFRMNPGYENLTRVEEGETLAVDRRGRIRARETGRILLPLYQGAGADGFFLAREVKPIWLWISKILRRLHAGRLAPLLPGVQRCPDRPGTLLVDSQIARWMAREVFHLLGYRKKRQEGTKLVVSRREFDI